MKNWKTHIKTNNIHLLLVTIFVLVGCQDKKEPVEIYVAEVGNIKLSQSELERDLGNNMNLAKYREEYIRDWIETEILFQISTENNLLNNNNYQKIIKNSQKELAASIAINNYLNSNPVSIGEKELRKYFEENKSDYNLSYDSYILNYAEFSSEESAINFRDNAIENGWDKAIQSFVNDSTLVINSENRLYKLSEIQSERTLRVLKKLFKNEISFVINTELNNFVVVQQLDEIVKNSTPKFQYVKENVRNSMLVLKQREQVRLLLDSLINQKNVKIY
jgi:uncharacterized protein YeeX (DUF496 family)